MNKYNLHTHSFYCGHGNGTIAEYVTVAKEEKLSVLGFSEHCPVPEDRWRKTRMAYASRPSYEADVRSAKEKNSSLQILLGYECDYFPEYDSYYRELKEQVDYLIMAVHFIQLPEEKDIPLHHRALGKRELYAYTDEYLRAMRSGLFLFGAHPDLFALNYLPWDDDAVSCSKAILSEAEHLHLPLEVNAYGLRKPMVHAPEGDRRGYPVLPFWSLAKEYDVQVVASADAHTPEALCGYDALCSDFIKPTGIRFADCPYGGKP